MLFIEAASGRLINKLHGVCREIRIYSGAILARLGDRWSLHVDKIACSRVVRSSFRLIEGRGWIDGMETTDGGHKWLSADRNGSQLGNINVRRASGCLRFPGIRCYLWQGWFKCRETCSWDRIGVWRTSLQRMAAFLVKILCFACGKQRRSIAGGDLTGETQKRRGREGSRVEEVEGVSQWFLLWPGSSSRPRKSAL